MEANLASCHSLWIVKTYANPSLVSSREGYRLHRYQLCRKRGKDLLKPLDNLAWEFLLALYLNLEIVRVFELC